MGRLQNIKKFSGALFFGALLSFSTVASFLGNGVAHANGETYARTGNNVVAKGGYYSQPITLYEAVLGGHTTYQATGQISGNGFTCVMNIAISASSPSSNTGTLIVNRNGVNPNGTCSVSNNTNYQAAVNYLNNSTVHISGNAGSQKYPVVIDVWGQQPANSLPDSLVLTIKDSQNRTISTSTLKRAGLDYHYSTNLDTGNYTACASKVVNYCQQFVVKAQTNPPNAVTLGKQPEAGDQRVINAEAVYTYYIHDLCSQQGQTIGPLTLTLTKKGSDNVIQTVKTNTFTPDGFGCDSQNTGSLQEPFNAQFTNVDPGTYTVCLQYTKVCKDVTKKYQIDPPKVVLFVTADDITKNTQSATDTPSCETTGFGLAWIMCKIIDGLADAVNGIYDGLVQPMLNTPGIGPTSSVGVPLKKAWSSFRVLADVLLVIALLVVVFGESIGGGMIDAYTVKKVLPRLLIAAVLINISYYLMEAAIDISNIIGRGLGGLITAPFGLTNGAGHFKFDLNGNGAVQETASLITFGGVTGAAAIAAAFAGITVASAGIGATLSFLFFFVLLPAIIIILAIVATLIIRVGLIYALVLAAPLAFAAYVLPNTEKYFKKWWEVLQELLMVYPIIAVLFALSQVLAQTSLWANANGSGVQQAFAFIASLIILLIPLAAIPFAFKLAGGLIGRVHELVHTGGQRVRGAINGNDKDPNSRRNWARTRMQLANVQARQDRYQALQDRVNNSRGVSRWVLRRRAGIMGGHNIEAATSAARAQVSKEINDQIATGRDDEPRGLTVNKQWAMAQAEFGDWTDNGDGTSTRSNGQVRETRDASGNVSRKFQTLAGAWVREADVDSAYARWGNNTFAQQAALSYELRKAQTDEQLQNLATNYRAVAQGRDADGNLIAGAGRGWGNTDQQAGGSWTGATFEHQNTHLDAKYTDWMTGKLKNGGKDFVTEVYEKRGTYQMSQMSAHTIEKLQEAYDHADRTGDVETKQKIQAVAENFMSRYGGGGKQVGNVDDQPIYNPAEQQQRVEAELRSRGVDPTSVEGQRELSRQLSSTYQTNAQGAAHVAQAVRRLAVHTGVYREELASPRTTSDRPNVNPATGNPTGPARDNPDIDRLN